MKNPSDEIAVATLLGIDPVHEPQYLWIARRALGAQLDSTEWKEFTNEEGRLMYYNVKLKVFMHMDSACSLTENPCSSSHHLSLL
jgi:hypothetical protein